MSKQFSLLNTTSSLEMLPTAKVKKADKVGVHAWTNFYASFSENFVNHILKSFNVEQGQTLLDPFVGSGTSMVSALKFGLPAIGVDLDPYSCLLSRSKVAINANETDVLNLLKKTTRKKPLSNFSEDAQKLFDHDCLCYASSVFTRILDKTKSNRANILDLLLSDSRGEYDSEVVALTAICIGASESAKVIKGSNPTWYRKALEGEKDTFEELFKSTKEKSLTMIEDLSQLKKEALHRDIRIINTDFRSINNQIEDNSIDHIITSPPYLTRLDYVIKNLPNLLILTGMIDFEIEDLRRKMIGTAKIIEKGNFPEEWGNTCNKILHTIKNHDSYASESYYIWTYSQYFKASFDCFKVLFKKSRKHTKGLLVIQDSFYKDIRIPLSQIIQEMLTASGYESNIVKKDAVTSHMKYINPKQQENSKKRHLREDSIFFKKQAQ